MLETNNENDFLSVNSIDLHSVIEQMEKDLASSGYRHTFKTHEVHALMTELTKELQAIDQAGLLSNVLYRIDLNESIEYSAESYFNRLARACWNRVFQKVWLRKNFKTGSK